MLGIKMQITEEGQPGHGGFIHGTGVSGSLHRGHVGKDATRHALTLLRQPGLVYKLREFQVLPPLPGL